MHLDTIEQASGSRFPRGSGHSGLGRRSALEGDARPGEVLAPAGGALVCPRLSWTSRPRGGPMPERGCDRSRVG
jgi:hypothetical protein